MTRTYVTHPVVNWDDWWADEPRTMTVVEEDNPPRRTGLLNARGQDLFAVEEREPVGFVKWRSR